MWSREAGSVVPSRASRIIRRTQAEYGAYSRTFIFSAASRTGVHLLYREPPSGHYLVYWVAQLSAYGVYRQEFDRIWPAVLKVALVTGAAYSRNLMNNFLYVTRFLHQLLYWDTALAVTFNHRLTVVRVLNLHCDENG